MKKGDFFEVNICY